MRAATHAGGGALKIEANELLALAENAQLQRRLPVSHLDKVADDARAFQPGAHRHRGLVVSNRGDERAVHAHRDDVQCHVGGPARTVFGDGDVDHGHRRFLGNAMRIAIPVPVHHDISHNDDAGGCGEGKLPTHAADASAPSG